MEFAKISQKSRKLSQTLKSQKIYPKFAKSLKIQTIKIILKVVKSLKPRKSIRSSNCEKSMVSNLDDLFCYIFEGNIPFVLKRL